VFADVGLSLEDEFAHLDFALSVFNHLLVLLYLADLLNPIEVSLIHLLLLQFVDFFHSAQGNLVLGFFCLAPLKLLLFLFRLGTISLKISNFVFHFNVVEVCALVSEFANRLDGDDSGIF